MLYDAPQSTAPGTVQSGRRNTEGTGHKDSVDHFLSVQFWNYDYYLLGCGHHFLSLQFWNYDYYLLGCGLLCYGVPSTVFQRKRSDASVYQKYF